MQKISLEQIPNILQDLENSNKSLPTFKIKYEEMLKPYQLIQLLMFGFQRLPGLQAFFRWFYYRVLDDFLEELSEHGVRLTSVYLKGSMAREDATYGLSDIDLFLVTESSLTPVQTAEIVRQLRALPLFRVMGEIEVLMAEEVILFQSLNSFLYPSLYNWRHYRGEAIPFLSVVPKAPLEIRLSFTCFQYLYFNHQLKQGSTILRQVKAQRLLVKLLTQLETLPISPPSIESLDKQLIARMRDLAGPLSATTKSLKLTGLYPFTCLFEGATFYISSLPTKPSFDERVFLAVTVPTEVVTLTAKLLTPSEDQSLSNELYQQVLFFQKYGMLLNLMGHDLRSENTCFVIEAVLAEAHRLSISGSALTNATIQFCEAARVELNKST